MREIDCSIFSFIGVDFLTCIYLQSSAYPDVDFLFILCLMPLSWRQKVIWSKKISCSNSFQKKNFQGSQAKCKLSD